MQRLQQEHQDDSQVIEKRLLSLECNVYAKVIEALSDEELGINIIEKADSEDKLGEILSDFVMRYVWAMSGPYLIL